MWTWFGDTEADWDMKVAWGHGGGLGCGDGLGRGGGLGHGDRADPAQEPTGWDISSPGDACWSWTGAPTEHTPGVSTTTCRRVRRFTAPAQEMQEESLSQQAAQGQECQLWCW